MQHLLKSLAKQSALEHELPEPQVLRPLHKPANCKSGRVLVEPASLLKQGLHLKATVCQHQPFVHASCTGTCTSALLAHHAVI